MTKEALGPGPRRHLEVLRSPDPNTRAIINGGYTLIESRPHLQRFCCKLPDRLNLLFLALSARRNVGK